MTLDRNANGTFVQGNRVSCLGWAGLVNKRFHGDEAAAKSWLVRVGKFAYGQMCHAKPGSAMEWRIKNLFAHPGTPEEFYTALRTPIPGDVDFYGMPAEIAGALQDVEQGVTYCPPNVDWAAVEDDRIGD